MKKNHRQGRIVLAPMAEGLRQMSGADPPALSIDKARQRLGPELRRLVTAGWLDEDIIASLQGQNPEDIAKLLIAARSDERQARRISEKKKAERALKRASNAPVTPSLNQPAPALILPKRSESVQPNFPARPLPLAITSDTHRSDTEQTPGPITRNRGIRRPD